MRAHNKKTKSPWRQHHPHAKKIRLAEQPKESWWLGASREQFIAEANRRHPAGRLG